MNIKPEDYKVTNFFVVVYNNTSGSSILDYTKIQFTEYDESSLALTLPKGTCSVGHSLTLYVSKDEKTVQVKKIQNEIGIPGTFAFTGKVTNLTTADEGLLAAQLTLTNYTKSEWEQIYKKFEEIQEKASGHFNRMTRSGKEFD